MQLSKQRFLALVGVAFLFACTPNKKSAEQLKEQESVDFYVASARGELTSDRFLEKQTRWQTYKIKTYHFTACLKTKAENKVIRNIKFLVLGAQNREEEQKLFRPFTDPNGCLKWQDNVRYSQFVEGVDLTRQYRIYAQGENNLYSGKVPVRFLINPWTKSEALYWRKGTTSPVPADQILEGHEISAQRLKGSDQEGAYPLVMDVTNFSASVPDGTSPNGFRVQMDLGLKPSFLIKNTSNELEKVGIQSGRFKVRVQLVATNVDGYKKGFAILSEEPTSVRNVSELDRILRFRLNFQVSRQAYRGLLKLLVQVEPHGFDAPKTLKSYEALYLIGHGSKRPYTTKPHLEQDSLQRNYSEGEMPFSYDDYVSQLDNFEELRKNLLAFTVAPFEFGTAKGTYEQVKPGETATQRTIQFRVRTCLYDGAFGNPVKFRKFKVTRISEDGKSKILGRGASVTDRQGCFSWPGEVSHAIYKKERIIPVHYDVEYDFSPEEKNLNNQKKLKKFTHRKTIYVNPWDDKFTFSRDAIELDREAQAQREKDEKIESRFFISRYTYETLKFGYELDNNLNLKVKKTVLLSLEPWVLRYNGNVRGRDTVYPLRDGIYLLKVGFQKDYLDPATKGAHILSRKTLMGENGGEGSLVQHIEPEDSNKNGIIEAHERFFNLSDDRNKNIRKQYISTVSKLVRVNRGQVITPIEVELRDLRLLRVRSQFLIQMQPIDERLLVVANKIDNSYTKEVTEEIEARFQNLIRQVREKKGEQQVEKVLESLQAMAGEVSALEADRVALNKHMYGFFGPRAQHELEALVIRKQAELEGVLEMLSPNVFKKLWYEENRADKYGLQQARQTARKLNLEKDKAYMMAQREFLEESKSGHLLDKALAQFDISKDVIASIEKDYVTNDFTTMSTAPLVEDLDVFVEPYEVSGLARRSFIGPITFIRNSNHGRVRPTDNIAELYGEESTVDSVKWAGITSMRIMKGLTTGSYKVSQERDQKFYQSVKHFSHKHVDDLIKVQKDIDRDFEVEQRAFAKLHNYVNLHDYEFVSLVDKGEEPEVLERILPRQCSTIYRPDFFETCYEEDNSKTLPLAKYLNSFNKYSNPSLRVGLAAGARKKMTKADLEDVIDTGILKDKHMYNMCYLFVNSIKNVKNKGKFVSECKSHIGTHTPPFIVEQKIRVEKIGNTVFKGGKQMNVNVGQSISLSRYEQMNTIAGLNISTMAGKFLQPFVSILGSTSGFLRIAYNYGRSKSVSLGTSITRQTFLVMQVAAFDIQFDEYRKCAVLRWNPKMFIPTLNNILGNIGENFEMPGGYMVCEGEIEKEDPLYVREHYYYFTQHFTDGDLLDPGDLYNHPWLLALRGVGDAARFLSFLEKNDYILYKIGGSEQFQCDEDSAEMGLKGEESMCKSYHQWPIQKLTNLYLKTTPTLPGIYTLLKEKDPDFPWTEAPRDSIESYKQNLLHENPAGVSQGESFVLGLPGFRSTSRLSFENLEAAREGVRNLKLDEDWTGVLKEGIERVRKFDNQDQDE